MVLYIVFSLIGQTQVKPFVKIKFKQYNGRAAPWLIPFQLVNQKSNQINPPREGMVVKSTRLLQHQNQLLHAVRNLV